MAKKKEEIVVSEYLDSSYILGNKPKIISISPGLDLILGGGIPEGTICILEGQPKTGKSCAALKAATKAQQQYDKTIIYCLVENRRSGFAKNLEGTPGLNLSPEKFKIIASEPGKILNTQLFLEKTEQAILEHPGCVVIFDSFSALSSADEKTKGYNEGFGGIDSRKMEGQFSRRIAPILSVTNATIIGIAHVTPRIGGMGKSTKISEALKYFLDVNIGFKPSYKDNGPKWMAGKEMIGEQVEAEVYTSALGAPGGKCVLWHKFGYNFLDEAETAKMAEDLDLIKKSGAWYTLPEKFDSKKFYFNDLVQFLIDNKEIHEEILSEVKSLLI